MSLRVRVRMDTWEQAVSFVSKNLSRGGMFLAMPDAAPKGTVLQMVILLPDGSEVSVRGEIRHAVSRERAEAEGRRAGVGVKFLGLDDDSKSRIGKVVDAARTLARGSETLPVVVSETSTQEEDDLLEALRAQLGELKEQDYFEVLGIPRDATEEDVELGYRAQMQRWDPAKVADKSTAYREVVADIVILLQEAHAALADAEFRAQLRGRAQPEQNGLDELFDDVQADEESGPPPDLDLDADANADRIQVILRKARAARQTEDFEQASQILAKALSSAPGDRLLLMEYHLTMGYAEQSQDAIERAARHFDEVIRINPEHRQAIAELRRMAEKPRKEKRALLKRLFHRNGNGR
jgi:uncharacterized protein (TIGR02266 family)